MIRLFARTGILLVVLSGPSAFAFENPLGGLQLVDRGPLADFLNIFREAGHPARGRRLAPRL
jgi:hypothetical protein